MEMPPRAPVLLFDGECGLCRRLVWLLLKTDRSGRLRFAPLQGRWAADNLRSHGLDAADLDTLVFFPGGEGGALQLRTDGALAAAASAGGPWRLVTWLRVVPAPWRDALYRIVARWRRRLGGRGPAPDLGRPEWRDRWMDGSAPA